MYKNSDINIGKASSVVCKEVFEDGYQPSSEEIIEYATHIGIDTNNERHLMHLAREGLLQAIPAEWKICYSDDYNAYYYYNTKTKIRQWEHPLDAQYKVLVERARRSHKISSGIHDLSEDASQIDSGIRSLNGDDSDLIKEISPMTSFALGTVDVIGKMDTPIQHYRNRILSQQNKNNSLSLAPIETITSASTKAPISLGFRNRDGDNKLVPNIRDSADSSSNATIEGYKLSGNGAMFLKTNANKKFVGLDSKLEQSIGETENERAFKSILRDKSVNNPRTEINLMEQDAESRKVVRFNFEGKEVTSEIEQSISSNHTISNTEENQDNLDVMTATKMSEWDWQENDSIKSESTQLTKETKKVFTPTIVRNENVFHKTELFKRQPNSRNVLEFQETDNETNSISYQDKVDRDEFKHDESIPNESEDSSSHQEQNELTMSRFKRIEISGENRSRIHQMDNKKLEKNEHEENIEKLKHEHQLAIEKLKQTLKDEYDMKHQALTEEHQREFETLKKTHELSMSEYKRNVKIEEDRIREEHKTALDKVKRKLHQELEFEQKRLRETGENHLYEKIRCEKRLLEDKYRCLKDKYVKLKTDVKVSLERKNQRHSSQKATTPNTESVKKSLTLKPGQEQSRSSSHKREKKHSSCAESSYLSYIQDDTTSISQSDATFSNPYKKLETSSHSVARKPTNENDEAELRIDLQKCNDNPDENRRERKKQFSQMKLLPPSRHRIEHDQFADSSSSHLENLREQLKKLEDLEDRFQDQNSIDSIYLLRYPFALESSQEQFGGLNSELEFFKHRIHLERDSLRRANDTLCGRANEFSVRQRKLDQLSKQAGSDIGGYMFLEGRELMDMELDLYRTRALLGEKVIRLRHLEQSLQRVNIDERYAPNKSIDKMKCAISGETIVSDICSHSNSTLNSTDVTNSSNGNHQPISKYPNEIVEILKSLYAEIREIWKALSTQNSHGMSSIPLILFDDFGWTELFGPATQPLPISGNVTNVVPHTTHPTDFSQPSNEFVHTSSLLERTQGLKRWLVQAKTEQDRHFTVQRTNI